jgi:hypothetical protein
MQSDKNQKYKYQRSYFGPILLITAGILFLLSNLDIIQSGGWEVIWKLWPLLLIVGGVDDLLRRRGIAWPILLIGAGVYLLYNYFGPQTWISWTQIFRLWPVVLIAIGIDILFRGQSGWMIGAGIVLTIALIGGSVWFLTNEFEITPEYFSVQETYPSAVKFGDLSISLGMGELVLGDTNSSQIFIEGDVIPEIKIEQKTVSGNTISYELENNVPDIFPYTARWELDLAKELEMDLNVNNGVGELFLTLEELQLKDLDANQGVGRLVLRLPKSIESEILVKQAVGSILIQIPTDALIAVDAKNGLSRVDFPPDFELEAGYYSSPGATKNNADLLIVVELAIVLVSIVYLR